MIADLYVRCAEICTLVCVTGSFGFVFISDTPAFHFSEKAPADILFNKGTYTGNGETVEYWKLQAKKELKMSLKQNIVGVAKNTILFLGDGMGLPSVTAGRILKGQINGQTGEEAHLSWDDFPNTALSKTYNQDHTTPDSAGTGTAYMTGVKTNKGVIGVDARTRRGECLSFKGHELSSILDWSLAEGKSVGIVTTTRVTHATPASAFAHTPERDWEGDVNIPAHAKLQGCTDIARQLVEDNPRIQVILGGGRGFFLPSDTEDPEKGDNAKYGRKDGRNLIKQWMDEKQQRGVNHNYVWNALAFHDVNPDTTDYLLGLFNNGHMQYEIDRNDTNYEVAGEPSISEMTEKAINILQKNPKGYFLLVEGGRIDHGHHESKAKKALYDVVAMSDAVAKANTMTNENDTLIVVTADHSHTMMLSGYPTRGNDIFGLVDDGHGGLDIAEDHKPRTTLIYGNGPGAHMSRSDLTHVNTDDKEYVSQSAVPLDHETHGGEDVAIYARGPMAHLYRGVHEQNYIPNVMAFASCVGDYRVDSECAKSLIGRP